MPKTFARRPVAAFVLFSAAVAAAPAGAQADPAPAAPAASADNPYRIEPWHADFPVELQWPNRSASFYDRTRRQVLEQLCANLQGNVRKEAWHLATEFFQRAPDDAVEPLVAAMDRAFANPALSDVVRNCVEAMGRMGNPRFEPALRRAAEHGNPKVHQAAFLSLATSSTPATLRTMRGWFDRMDGRARNAWLRAVRERLGADAVPLLRDVMMAPYPIDIRDQVLREVVQMPAAAAAEVLRGRWEEALGEFKAIIAGVLHQAGDPAGTAWLLESLRSEDPNRVLLATRYGTYGDVGPLREYLLRLSTHERTDVRYELARALVRVDGDDVADVYELLTTPDEQRETRLLALRELTRRGRDRVVTAMLEEVATASGTRLELLLGQVAASGDPRCVPDLVARFRKAPEGEGRTFLQALAHNGSAAAAAALLELFRGPTLVVQRGNNGAFTTGNYVPTLLLNLRGVETQVFDAWDALPRDDWWHRAALLPTLVGLAADRKDPALRQRAETVLRTLLFDRNELPQMRVLALNLWTRQFSVVDDVLRLKNALREEAPGLRAVFNDWLLDYF
ncbi:MAG: HEAT repeat domain-containing protein [Planctomycetes bacterium]|nr:HEAT repeat domain-containing protein [Planctomycetota bacterium]